jgi:hypothetical protein
MNQNTVTGAAVAGASPGSLTFTPAATRFEATACPGTVVFQNMRPRAVDAGGRAGLSSPAARPPRGLAALGRSLVT